jgi:mRNA interferase RelE/StbE
MFDVFLGREAEKTLGKIDKKLSVRIKQALLTLKLTPLPVKEYNLKKISGTDNIYRIRISDYRIIYAIYWDKKEINVIRIARRDDRTYRGI